MTSATRYPARTVGSDVSYPQCNPDVAGQTATPATGGFGIVGLTDGKPWIANPCAGTEWAAANELPKAPELYLNTANPAPTSSFYWPTSGSRDPKLCKHAKQVSDPGCAYDYGWHSAKDAVALATQAGITNPTGTTWWLDVEGDNTWNGTPKANAADLQGVADYLHGHGVTTIGLYTSTAAWTAVTGRVDKANAAAYRKAWKPEFTPSYSLTSAPIWKLGVGSATSAAKACTTISPTGAATWLSQYAGGIDQDLACAKTRAATFSLKSTSHVTASRGSRRRIRVTVTETGPAQAVQLTVTKVAGITARLSAKTASRSRSLVLTLRPGSGASTGVHHLKITATGITGVKTKVLRVRVR